MISNCETLQIHNSSEERTAMEELINWNKEMQMKEKNPNLRYRVYSQTVTVGKLEFYQYYFTIFKYNILYLLLQK